MDAAAAAFLAGLLSLLTPSILALVPVAAAGAASARRAGALAVTGGIVLSFAAIALFLNAIGFERGIDTQWFRTAGSTVLVALGVLMLRPREEEPGRVGRSSGLAPLFLVGVLLGLVWSPCAGPTVGAAAALAAQRTDLLHVTAILTAFALGAALPFAAIGASAHAASMKWRLRGIGTYAPAVLAVMLMALGTAILTRADRRIETYVVERSPAWLTELTTRY